MPDYLIRPKAPLLFRNAKPFASGEGGAETLPFPSPSTISGALRTAWAEQHNLAYNPTNAERLRQKPVLGPLLVSETTQARQLLLPAPRDSLCLGNGNNKTLYRIAPQAQGDDEGCDLPHASLLPLHLQCNDNGKPARGAPEFWYLDRLIDWLKDDRGNAIPAHGQGVGALPIEYRTHVAIARESGAARDAHLFETAGLDFSPRRKTRPASVDDHPGGWGDEQFALLVRWPDDDPIRDDYRTIGGEARLGHIEQADKLWPACPQELTNKLKQSTGLRLYLATPALFKHGWLPGFIDPETLGGELRGVKLKLRAAAMPRWQAGASWNMLERTGKGMRTAQRMAPAGAVYWFEIDSGHRAAALADLWLTSISDQRGKDGFGLVLPGVWNRGR